MFLPALVALLLALVSSQPNADASPAAQAVTPTPSPSPTPVNQIAFFPTDDAYVAADAPASNFGGTDPLQADGSPIRDAYMKFDLRSLAGQTINSAKLQMFITNASVGSQNIKAVADTSWSQATVNYNNRPPKGASITSFTPNGAVSSWVVVDLTSTVSAAKGSFLSLAIDTVSTDAFMFSSREAAANRVHLAVQTASGATSSPGPSASAAPTPTPSPSPTPSPTPSNMTSVFPSDDAYISGSFPTANFGTTPDLWTDSSPIQDSFLKFNLTHLVSQTIVSGKLRMWVWKRPPFT